MTNKNDALKQAEKLLTPLALPHIPQESSIEAVVDQWLHAIATDSKFYCNPNISCPEELKNSAVSHLKEHALYKTRETFYDDVFFQLPLKPVLNPKFRFIDLFAGIGGVRLGFQQNGGACVFSSEFDKHAQQTYKANHGEVPFGDITQVPASEIPDHDVLLAGFPCQPFSHAGLKLGVEDTRGTLFHDIANILTTKRPRFALLENVKGLISHDKGHTLKVILNTLTNIGYSCNIPKEVIEHGSTKEIQKLAKEMVLKSVDYGIPQNRQRIYIVLWRDGEIEKFGYPKPFEKITTVGDILEQDPDPKLTISDKLWAGHQRRKAQNKINGKGFGFGIVTAESPYTNTISARYYKDGSEVLIEQPGRNPRKLSPREAARLQGFPDEFELNPSKVQSYKQFGNSVTVDVINALAKQIAALL
ncbi:DNA cytosine methyltransferase [Alteromonas sp. CI.11.F.A3]|uniref:DNA cytosine methyltransferase n=1 Tax=Alteromonas sp. CI.11.F.A3 TaxID=3079555 RepID=UPI002941E6DF|nr:DNA cytosine methyltransferase [Alteromonas sp. CI.11.F.A3]WOI37485.1 DNA cytosine methyltransferase [Alteromonas sp. CI.11.F.A3]